MRGSGEAATSPYSGEPIEHDLGSGHRAGLRTCVASSRPARDWCRSSGTRNRGQAWAEFGTQRLELSNPGLSRATYLDALSAGIFTGRLASPGSGVPEVASAAPPPQTPRAPDLLLDGLTVHYNEGYAAGLPMRVAAR